MDFINNSDHYDQHFLKNDDIIYKFIDVSNLNKNDIVVEIGPGKGVITEKIAPKVKHLYCIELDTRLKPFLDAICKKYNNVEVIYSSVLDTFVPECTKIITSLPYSIVEPFMNKMLKCQFKELIMITGSRFAENILNNEINRLSLMVNCFFDTEKIMDISPDNFYPSPRVMSAMIKLTPKIELENDLQLFFRKMFLLRNKKIKNCLVESLILTEFCSTQREAREIVESLNFSDELLETKFEVCSNEQLFELYNNVEDLYNEKNRYRTSGEKSL